MALTCVTLGAVVTTNTWSAGWLSTHQHTASLAMWLLPVLCADTTAVNRLSRRLCSTWRCADHVVPPRRSCTQPTGFVAYGSGGGASRSATRASRLMLPVPRRAPVARAQCSPTGSTGSCTPAGAGYLHPCSASTAASCCHLRHCAALQALAQFLTEPL